LDEKGLKCLFGFLIQLKNRYLFRNIMLKMKNCIVANKIEK